MIKIGFEEARQLQFDMLIELDDVCTKHGLTYFLAYGSLLGAVRHGGFIPWDDDIDVIMPLEDIDKLSILYKSDTYSVVTCNNNKEHAYPFARLYNNNTYSKYGKYHTLGIGIDIYPMVNAPVKNQEKYINSIFKYVPRRLFLIRLIRVLAKRGLWPRKNLHSILLSSYCQKMVEIMRHYNKFESDYVFVYSGGRHIMMKDAFYPTSNIEFNGRKFKAPSKSHELLSCWYGDYMQLPPKEEQVPRHIVTCYKYE